MNNRILSVIYWLSIIGIINITNATLIGGIVAIIISLMFYTIAIICED